MKIGDRVFIRGYIDEIRKDTVIIRNAGGYFGTVKSEIIEADTRVETESEPLKVGDEVQYIPEGGRIINRSFRKPRFVITSVSHDGSLNGIGKDGIAFCDKNPARWHKTGRHFVEAEKLMKALEVDHDSD